jgi:hypothetical protein
MIKTTPYNFLAGTMLQVFRFSPKTTNETTLGKKTTFVVASAVARFVPPSRHTPTIINAVVMLY